MNAEYTFQETKFQSRQGININYLIYMGKFESPFSHFVLFLLFLKDFFFFLMWTIYILHCIHNNIVSVLCFGFLAAKHVGSQGTRPSSLASIGEPNLYHWTTREVPHVVFNTKRWP